MICFEPIFESKFWDTQRVSHHLVTPSDEKMRFYCDRCPHKTFMTQQALLNHEKSKNVTAHNYPEFFNENIDLYMNDRRPRTSSECYNDMVLYKYFRDMSTPTPKKRYWFWPPSWFC